MYPLRMDNKAAAGFAVANTEAEHRSLTLAGYGPAFVAPAAVPVVAPVVAEVGHTLDSARAALDAAGIAYDKRFGLAKLVELLP